MKIETFSRKLFNYYNDTQIKLAENQESLSDFIGLPFSLDSIKKQIDVKKDNFSSERRKILKTHFENQYNGIEISSSIETNIKLLENENSFTITTGQQLTLFGGPAFFFYKIIHCISITQKLKELYPEYHFIPVFWLASEDHDKTEISETTIFNQNFCWENDFNGATGEFALDEKFNVIKNSISEIFSKSENKEIKDHISAFEGKTLSEGFIRFLTSLFKDYGLLVLDANSKILKNQLNPLFKNEINEFSTHKNVSETDLLLIQRGFEPQAKIQPINFFKLSKNRRSKIQYKDNKFFISDIEISKEKLLLDIEDNPETFSPNVFLRPLFQELILPNIAYIGGPGELSYWMQLKNNFIHYSIPYPILINRISIYYIDSTTEKKRTNFSFSFVDFINNTFDDLKKTYLQSTQDYTNLNWENVDNHITSALLESREIFKKNTPEIESFLESEWKNLEKITERLKVKVQKQVSAKHDVEIKQIEQIKNKIVPNAIPQERYFHFFTFCPDGSLNLMRELIQEIDPFSSEILVVTQ
jgi:bacillithiol biosynthesis cysteine-adding enzyme BshC